MIVSADKKFKTSSGKAKVVQRPTYLFPNNNAFKNAFWSSLQPPWLYPHSHQSERSKLCQGSTVIQKRSKVNINTEKKSKTSLAMTLDRDKTRDLPGPSMSELNLQVEQERMHHNGAGIPKRSETNVSKMKHNISSKLPWDRGKLWMHSCCFPIGKSNEMDTHHQDACRAGVPCHSPRLKRERDRVDATQWLCQCQHKYMWLQSRYTMITSTIENAWL